jgi:hypothetical protein
VKLNLLLGMSLGAAVLGRGGGVLEIVLFLLSAGGRGGGR